jgi:penicillin-insensitive murein endopeptidase
MRARGATFLVAGLVVAWGAAVGVAWLRVAVEGGDPSRSSGTVAQGRLEHGRPMRPWGPGYVTYSFLGAALGRQYVHGAVRDALEASFAAVASHEPRRAFVVGETGWPAGGQFRPHRTHQNGLSIDIFMPLVDGAGAPATPGTWPWNKLGYGLEFDAEGRLGSLRIDFEALAGLLRELQTQATARGLVIQRVMIAPEYVPLLLAMPSGRQLGTLADVLSRWPAWVRHDEHFHVDFGKPEPQPAPAKERRPA